MFGTDVLGTDAFDSVTFDAFTSDNWALTSGGFVICSVGFGIDFTVLGAEVIGSRETAGSSTEESLAESTGAVCVGGA
ncbi:hypothetical protein N7V09_13640 [Shewanella seohaensis]|nr:hypothetical protein [Shewanella seohaensis]UXM80905.1 hypothetical protein N7V09_13640 [Shewanella seohaensis]